MEFYMLLKNIFSEVRDWKFDMGPQKLMILDGV